MQNSKKISQMFVNLADIRISSLHLKNYIIEQSIFQSLPMDVFRIFLLLGMQKTSSYQLFGTLQNSLQVRHG